VRSDKPPFTEGLLADLFGDPADLVADGIDAALKVLGGQKDDLVGDPAPEEWDEWLSEIFPDYCSSPFADRHREFWEQAQTLTVDTAPIPFVSPWPRGGGKSTSAELGVAYVGVTNRRKYILYVSETQDQADKHVETIAGMLESEEVERYYPAHAKPMVGKFGNQKGWRRERLMTHGGLVIDALGLDTAARGIKVGRQRPDLIVLDDIDNKADTPGITAKKIATLTTSILPAGARNVAVWVIQNLIIPHGIVTRVVDGRADFLTQRRVSGPHPAVRDMKWSWVEDRETGTRRALITSGIATWEGQNLDVCQHLVDTVGIDAFLKECQHEVYDSLEGRALRVTSDHLEDLTDEDCRSLIALGSPFAGIDFGDWRFAFVLRAVDTSGVIHQIAEIFSQRQELEYRAWMIHALALHYGCPSNMRIRGDAANPTDIREINAAFKRIGSQLRVRAVTNEHKARTASVTKMNDLLKRMALRYRRGVHHATQSALEWQWRSLKIDLPPPEVRRWRHGWNASSAGTEMDGSRLQWEMSQWAYPAPKEGEAQKQDPDDHTADGADLIAADRYAIMSHLRPGRKEEEPPQPPTRDRDLSIERFREKRGLTTEEEKQRAEEFLRGLRRKRI
jgi:hypothetical protein